MPSPAEVGSGRPARRSSGWSAPFGGLPVVGAVAALALWLYLLHVLLLAGYRFAATLDGRPAA